MSDQPTPQVVLPNLTMTTPAASATAVPVRIQDQMLQALQQQIAEVPADQRGSMSVVVGRAGVQLVVGGRVSEHVEIAARAERTWAGSTEAAGLVRITWAP